MNTAELREMFTRHAQTAGLSVECAMSGTMNATLAVIAEAPGRSEVAQGLPLVGASGSLLWTSLRRTCPTIKRQDVYVTNVVKRQIAFELGNKRPVSKQELASWQALLLWELSLLPNLKHVLLMGGMAIEACLGKKGALKWRGSVLPMPLENKILTAVCVVNAAACLHDPLQHSILDMDLGDKLQPVVEGRYSEYTITTHINPTLKEACDYIDACTASIHPVASDIEVISNETACVGLALTPHDAMCIPFRSETEHVYSVADELYIRRKLQRFYTAPRTKLVWQNGGFDASWLWFKDRIYTKPAYSDTMLAHHVLYPPMPHDLGFIVKQYTTHAYYKDEKDEWRHTGGVDNFWQYNCRDCALTLASDIHLRRELKEQGLDAFYFEHVMRLQAHLVRMTVGGVLNDMSLREDMLAEDREGNLYDDLQKKLGSLYAAIKDAVGDEYYRPNPNSPKQMSDLYFSRLRLVGRGTSTDAENRRLMYKHPRTSDAAKRILRAVDEYSADHKFYSVYASARPDYDQRMRCDYRQTGVKNAPGRLSSAQTLWGSGGNLQNIPDRAKSMFITDPDYVFIYIDGSQAEARVVGWRYVIDTWMQQFEKARIDGKYDAHRALAADMFDTPYNQVPSFDRYALDEAAALRDGIEYNAALAGQPTIRYIAKRCRHGLNYRMMPDRLALTTGLPLATATEAFVKYHRLSPEIKKGWQHDLDLIKSKRAIYNAYGRRYYQFAPITDETTESIVAFYHQSTIGDHVCRVIYKSHDDDKFPKGKARIALNTHDGLIGLAHKSVARQALRVLIKHAETPLNIVGVDRKTRQLIIPAEIGMSVPDADGTHRWSTIKKMKKSEL
jgi:DNA polymerase I - 3''-5'' exonuclease and polymerase domains